MVMTKKPDTSLTQTMAHHNQSLFSRRFTPQFASVKSSTTGLRIHTRRYRYRFQYRYHGIGLRKDLTITLQSRGVYTPKTLDQIPVVNSLSPFPGLELSGGWG